MTSPTQATPATPPGRTLLRTAARRQLLLDAIRAEGGEWTPGRVKHTYRRHHLTHVYRATIRHDLAALHNAGHLARTDTPGRRFYTSTEAGSR